MSSWKSEKLTKKWFLLIYGEKSHHNFSGYVLGDGVILVGGDVMDGRNDLECGDILGSGVILGGGDIFGGKGGDGGKYF